MTTTLLKPCPFCGESEAYPDERNDSDGFRVHVIRCQNCGAYGPEIGDVKYGRDLSITTWNERKDP